MPAEKQELNQMLTFLSDIIDLLNPTHLILLKFYVQAWAKINIQGRELMLNPTSTKPKTHLGIPKTRRLLSLNKKQPLKKWLELTPKPQPKYVQVSYIHIKYNNQKLRQKHVEITSNNQKKHAKSIFPKNAFKEPILHWYQWQVHKVPSRPMVLLWNLASLVPKPIQQLILDHPGSRGFSDGWFILRNQ